MSGWRSMLKRWRLRQVRQCRDVGRLSEYLRHADHDVRLAAVEGLTDCRSERAVDELRWAANNKNSGVHKQANFGLLSLAGNYAIGLSGPQVDEASTLQAFLNLMDYPEPTVKMAAMCNLTCLRGTSARAATIECLLSVLANQEEDHSVRMFAASALGDLASASRAIPSVPPQVTQGLIAAFKNDPHELVRESAKEGLTKLNDPSELVEIYSTDAPYELAEHDISHIRIDKSLTWWGFERQLADFLECGLGTV